MVYTPPEDLIISPSGMRGIVGKNLSPEIIVKFCGAYGSWLKKTGGKTPKVLIGMDTRTTGNMVKSAAIAALQSVGVEVIDAGVCATPVLMYGHKFLDCMGTAIISASHNPPEYNGMKCLAPSGTFLSREELTEINQFFHEHVPKSYVSWTNYIPVIQNSDLTRVYLNAMKEFLDPEAITNKSQGIKVVVDPGAGAGTGVTAGILQELGFQVVEINGSRTAEGNFPRAFEPIKEHLSKLTEVIEDVGADVAFAHDCDADRVTLINEQGKIYREDVILALIWNDLLNGYMAGENNPDIKLVTNCASSLVFDDLASQYNSNLYFTPVGERYLAEKIVRLKEESPDSVVFGGEGSCGGFMFPAFNNTRDGIFAAVKICEILAKTGKSITELVSEIPMYVSLRKKVSLQGTTAGKIMGALKQHLRAHQVHFDEIDRDVKVFGNKEWTLVHPSNTEPIIRIITESQTHERSSELLGLMEKTIGDL